MPCIIVDREIAYGPRRQHRYALSHDDHLRPEDLSTEDIIQRPNVGKLFRIRELIRDLRQGFGVSKTYRFRRSLGAGGFGVTALVDQFDGGGNYEGQVAVKINLRHDSLLRRERSIAAVSSPLSVMACGWFLRCSYLRTHVAVRQGTASYPGGIG